MRTETKTKTQNIERKETRYHCEEEGCEYSTTSKQEAERHHAKKHLTFQKEYIDLDPDGDFRPEIDLVRINSEEEFNAYREHHQSGFKAEASWQGPGWYESWSTTEPCPRGCCTDEWSHLRPASETLTSLKETRARIDEAIAQMEKMEVTD